MNEWKEKRFNLISNLCCFLIYNWLFPFTYLYYDAKYVQIKTDKIQYFFTMVKRNIFYLLTFIQLILYKLFIQLPFLEVAEVKMQTHRDSLKFTQRTLYYSLEVSYYYLCFIIPMFKFLKIFFYGFLQIICCV